MAKKSEKKDTDSRKSKDARRTTPADRSSARMRQYLYLALALGCSLPILVPLFWQLLQVLFPPLYTELITPTPAQLHRVFFSGESHIVFCTNQTGADVPRVVRRVSEAAVDISAVTKTEAELDVDELDLTSSEKERTRKDGVISSPSRVVTVSTLDCAAPLPSGKSVLERFALTLPSTAPPTKGAVDEAAAAVALAPAFYVSGGERPRWLPREILLAAASGADARSRTLLSKHVASRMTSRTAVIASNKFLATKCTSRRTCALVLHAGRTGLVARDLVRSVRALHRDHPAVVVATLDVRAHTIDLQRSLGQLDDADQAQWPRLLLFRRYPLTAGEEPALFVKSFKGAWDPNDVSDFIATFTDRANDTAEASTDTSSSSDQKPRATSLTDMAVLKRAPQLRNGANNFGGTKKSATTAATKDRATKKSAAGASRTGTAAGTKKTTSQSSQQQSQEQPPSPVSDQREREARRRAEMEAEAADYLVQEADEDDLVSELAEEQESPEEEDEDEEVVMLEDDDEL